MRVHGLSDGVAKSSLLPCTLVAPRRRTALVLAVKALACFARVLMTSSCSSDFFGKSREHRLKLVERRGVCISVDNRDVCCLSLVNVVAGTGAIASLLIVQIVCRHTDRASFGFELDGSLPPPPLLLTPNCGNQNSHRRFP
ncbi:hypothetical protein F2Q68_00030682 [Brassica cretica]|uniref:Uncharacterized protein n=2 Tax=Brassica cretica TaxID=69181 RepID=A0A8S9GE65_BRACR|nr:hypothetical protein F2Q68_00030682 [Brassica cretica]KAF3530953.1 hypothetical protein DY000_02039239 [Brassica cretica]